MSGQLFAMKPVGVRRGITIGGTAGNGQSISLGIVTIADDEGAKSIDIELTIDEAIEVAAALQYRAVACQSANGVGLDTFKADEDQRSIVIGRAFFRAIGAVRNFFGYPELITRTETEFSRWQAGRLFGWMMNDINESIQRDGEVSQMVVEQMRAFYQAFISQKKTAEDTDFANGFRSVFKEI